jgi:hypothetical protein
MTFYAPGDALEKGQMATREFNYVVDIHLCIQEKD